MADAGARSRKAEATDLEIFKLRLNSRRAYVAGGIAVLAAGAVWMGVAFLMQPNNHPHSHSNAVWFIALLVIFMAALATTAAVFTGLRMSSPNEAFGLPSGSIRALLAVGIMILFVVFGLQYLVDPAGQSAPADYGVARVDAAKVDAERARYEQQGFKVIVRSPGSAERTVNGVTTPAVEAQLQLLQSTGRSVEDRDLIKQLLTAIITLLTTVIGFYFGSRSAEAARDSAQGAPPPNIPPELAVRREKLGTALEALKTDLEARTVELSRIKQLPAPADATEAAKLADLKGAAEVKATELEQQRQAAADALADFDKEAAQLAKSERADVRAVHEGKGREQLATAEKAIEALKTGFGVFALQMDVLRDATAEG